MGFHTTAERLLTCIIVLLVCVMAILVWEANRDLYPIYPLPLHPGTQVILHQTQSGWSYKFRFINSTADISMFYAAVDSECTQPIQQVGIATGDEEIDVPPQDARRDICVTVQPAQFPMVYECWPGPAMAASYSSCVNWDKRIRDGL